MDGPRIDAALRYTLGHLMTCPSCATDLPAPTVANLVICPNPDCLRSIAIFNSVSQMATSADTLALSVSELVKLRAQRKSLRNA